MDSNYMMTFKEAWDIASANPLMVIAFIVLIAIVVRFVAHKLIARIVRHSVRARRGETRIDEKKREDTLIGIFGKLETAIVWVTAALFILQELGVNLSALFAGAGFFGVIIGLGAQNTIRDLLAGTFILIEHQYRVGDVVTLSGGLAGVGATGIVEEITLRVTKIRDAEGTLNVMRNGDATVIANRTFKHSAVVVDINISYDSDVDTVEEIMNKVGLEVAGDEKWKSSTIEPIQFQRIDTFTDTAAVARAIGKVAPASQWDIAGDYRRRLLGELKAKNIEVGNPITVKAPSKPRQTKK